MHHGVQGQKWGVRRWQNPDGSLTPEGRKHYGLNTLDYNERYSGDKKAGIKAYKQERKALRKAVAQVEYDDEVKWDDRLGQLENDMGEYSKIQPGDLSEYRNAEKDLNEDSEIMWKSYQKGLEEVDRYLKGKYGDEIVSAYNKGKKAKTIAIGAGVVAGSTILGVGVWHGNKAHKNNELRKSEDVYYERAKNSQEDYENATKKRQQARSDEFFAKQERDIASNKYVNSDHFNKEDHRTVYQIYERDYQKKKEAARKAADYQTHVQRRMRDDENRYDKAAKERAQKISGLWKRKGDDERDDRYIELMKNRKW